MVASLTHYNGSASEVLESGLGKFSKGRPRRGRSQHLAPPDLRPGTPECGPLHPQLLAARRPPRTPQVYPLPPPPYPHQALLLGRWQPHSIPQSPCQPSAHWLRTALRSRQMLPGNKGVETVCLLAPWGPQVGNGVGGHLRSSPGHRCTVQPVLHLLFPRS